jgi:hypothetical protein
LVNPDASTERLSTVSSPFLSLVEFLSQRRMMLCLLNFEVERAMTFMYMVPGEPFFLTAKKSLRRFFMHSGDNKRFCEYAQF